MKLISRHFHVGSWLAYVTMNYNIKTLFPAKYIRYRHVRVRFIVQTDNPKTDSRKERMLKKWQS